MKKSRVLVLIGLSLIIQIGVFTKEKEPVIILPKNAEGIIQYQEAFEIPGISASL